MDEEKADRRVQRTRQLLRQAIMELVEERGFDAVTIQDITDRANLGRTTFYTHYQSKEDLFLDCHHEMVHHMIEGFFVSDDLLNENGYAGLAIHLGHIRENRALYYDIMRGSGSEVINRGLMNQLAIHIENSLKAHFDEAVSSIPFDVLAHYIAGAQMSLANWWIENRAPYSAEDIARMLYRLQKAAICDTLGLFDSP